MLLKRQRQLLALLDAHRGHVGNLDFQKLLFLYCQGVETVPSYDFVPYKFGGFSFTSYADKRRLIAQRCVAAQKAAHAREIDQVLGRSRLGRRS